MSDRDCNFCIVEKLKKKYGRRLTLMPDTPNVESGWIKAVIDAGKPTEKWAGSFMAIPNRCVCDED